MIRTAMFCAFYSPNVSGLHIADDGERRKMVGGYAGGFGLAGGGVWVGVAIRI